MSGVEGTSWHYQVQPPCACFSWWGQKFNPGPQRLLKKHLIPTVLQKPLGFFGMGGWREISNSSQSILHSILEVRLWDHRLHKVHFCASQNTADACFAGNRSQPQREHAVKKCPELFGQLRWCMALREPFITRDSFPGSVMAGHIS